MVGDSIDIALSSARARDTCRAWRWMPVHHSGGVRIRLAVASSGRLSSHLTSTALYPSPPSTGSLSADQAMDSQNAALLIGCIFVGALCTYGAINQVRRGETWGATGKGRVRRAEEPVYFWYVFLVRMLLGPVLLVLGLLGFM